MSDRIRKVEVFIVSLHQDGPYLGSLRKGETVNQQGYFVRRGNRTVYPRSNRSIVVRLTTDDGIVGWGETYGLVAPKATAEIIDDLLRAFVVDRSPLDAELIHDDLSDLMRVRGYVGGYYSDALAAIDIALWDIKGKQLGQSLGELFGSSNKKTIPAYVSGLPKDTLAQRCELAVSWKEKGFADFKFALPVADDGLVTEFQALREALGGTARIACDMHWAFQVDEVDAIAKEVSAYDPWFLEAPLSTEDIEGLSILAQKISFPIAIGEEWRTVFDAKLRIDCRACRIVQPEMGHTGVTQFKRIAQCAREHGLQLMPHATIGCGIFLAASLQAASSMEHLVGHEFQHSIHEPLKDWLSKPIQCDKGHYTVPCGPGIGVEPSEQMQKHMTPYP